MKNTSTQQKLSIFKCSACKRQKDGGRSEAFIDKEDQKKLLHKCEPPLSMPALGGDRSCLPSVQVSLLWTPSSSTSPRAPRHFEIERKIINPPLYFFYFQFEHLSLEPHTVHPPPTSRHTFYSALLQTLPHIRKQKPIQMYPEPGVHKLIKICSEEG